MITNVLFSPQIVGDSPRRKRVFDAMSVMQSHEINEADALDLLLEAAGDDQLVLTQTSSQLKEYQRLLNSLVEYEDPLLDDIVELVTKATSVTLNAQRNYLLFSRHLVREERQLVGNGIRAGFCRISLMEPKLLELEELVSSEDWRVEVGNDLLGGTPPDERNRLLRRLLSHAERKSPEPFATKRQEGADKRLWGAISVRLRTVVGPWSNAKPDLLSTFVAEAVAKLHLASIADLDVSS